MKFVCVSPTLFAATLLVVCALVLGGCRRDSSDIEALPSVCKTYYDRAHTCLAEEAPFERDFLKECEARPDIWTDVLLACAKTSECSEFKVCLTAHSEPPEVASYREALAGAISSGTLDKLLDVSHLCDSFTEKEIKQALIKECADFRDSIDALLVLEVEHLRDEGLEDERNFCRLLEDIRAQGEPEGSQDKVTICLEHKTSLAIPEAIQAVETQLAEHIDKVPFECKYQLDQLDELDTEWATLKTEELATLCYVHLGAVILQNELPSLTRCKRQVKIVYQAVTQYGLSSPELDPLIEQIAALCQE